MSMCVAFVTENALKKFMSHIIICKRTSKMAATSKQNYNLPADSNLPGIFGNLERHYSERPLLWWDAGVLKQRDLDGLIAIDIIEKDFVGENHIASGNTKYYANWLVQKKD